MKDLLEMSALVQLRIDGELHELEVLPSATLLPLAGPVIVTVGVTLALTVTVI